MRIALCFSGHMRTYEKTYAAWKRYVIDPLQPDIFIDTWNTIGTFVNKDAITGNGGVHKKTLVTEPGTVMLNSHPINQEEIIKRYNPVGFNVEIFEELMPIFIESVRPIVEWRDSSPPNAWRHMPLGTYSQLYKWWKCNQQKQNYETTKGFKYDLVIRSRTDLMLEDNITHIIQMALTEPTKIYVPVRDDPMAVRDVIFVGSSKNIDILCNMYTHYHTLFEMFKSADDADGFCGQHKAIAYYLMHMDVLWQDIVFPIRRWNHCLIR